MLVVDQNIEQPDSSKVEHNEKFQIRVTDNGKESNKCNICNYAFARAGTLKIHFKMHIGEKSNKCNHCDYACYDPSALRAHLRTHTGQNKIHRSQTKRELMMMMIIF